MLESLLHLNLSQLIQTAGYIGLFAIVFAESGLFFGFFLPGDSLLFTAGLLASSGYFNIYVLCFLLAVAAVLGDNVGYWFGKTVGPRIFTREDSLFFRKTHVLRAKEFYEKYGPKALVIGRFIPIVRTFIPIVAGVGGMHYPTFMRYNLIGGLLWAVGVTVLGYSVGTRIPHAEEYLTYIIIGIIVLSLVPIAVEFWREKQKN